MKKWRILWLGQRKTKMSLEYLMVPESEKHPQKTWEHDEKVQGQPEKDPAHQSENNFNNKINNNRTGL